MPATCSSGGKNTGLFTTPMSVPSSDSVSPPATMSSWSMSRQTLVTASFPLAARTRLPAAVVSLVPADGKPQTDFPGCVVGGHVVAIEQEAGFNPDLVERCERTWHHALRCQLVPYVANHGGIGKNLVATLTGIACARQPAGMAEQLCRGMLEIAQPGQIDVAIARSGFQAIEALAQTDHAGRR